MLQQTDAALRVLGPESIGAATALLDRDPAANVFVASRLHGSSMAGWRLGGELWGWFEDGVLASLCYAGANLSPVAASPAALQAYAGRAARQGRRSSSIVGEAGQVLELWRLLEPEWGPAREVRPRQPLMVLDGQPRVPADPAVRRVRPDEVDLLMPACVAMFTEEVGVSPVLADGGRLYRMRVEELVRAGRAFARIEDGEVVFKAELGAVSPLACQVQGVWVAPSRRGQGLAAPGMAAVARLAAEVVPVVSLYVNDYNLPARAAYRRVGFVDRGTFASVMF